MRFCRRYFSQFQMNFSSGAVVKSVSLFLLIYGVLWLSACANDDEQSDAPQTHMPWVKTIRVHADNQRALTLSGTVRARYETPVAFQLKGRIAARFIDAGQPVEKGQILFKLDTRDLKQSIRSAEAELAAAQSALAIATADLERDQKLVVESFISEQALERTVLRVREARTRFNASQARLEQARNAMDYADLRAENAGVLIEVSGEPGQIVNFGQPVALLARDGEHEVEVFFPENIKPHKTGSIYFADGNSLALKLRESAGAANPDSRTWRARYRIVADHQLPLGTVVRAAFTALTGTPNRYRVPLGALDERGKGVRVWQFQDNQVKPVPAQLIALDTEHAWIDADLPEHGRIVALGTHLLNPGMAVRALSQ